MLESIKCKQIRVLRACIFNDWVFVTNNTGYLSEPIAGKRIADVKFSKCKSRHICIIQSYHQREMFYFIQYSLRAYIPNYVCHNNG